MVKTSICVLIMAKDEAHCILDTLNSTLPYATEYIICDTGSTDNTPEVCKEFFKKHGISWKIFYHGWVGFDYNYSYLYKLGKDHSACKYLWQIDADDVVVGEMNIEKLFEDCYMVKFGKDFTYPRQQIFKNKIAWHHVGVIHGYVRPVDEKVVYSRGKIEGDYYINSRRLGARHKMDPKERYAKDAQTLEDALMKEPNNSRYMFYCGRCYFDSAQYEKAIQKYNRRIKIGGWQEEVYYSRYDIGNAYKKLGKPLEEVVKKYMDCYEHHKHRAEPLYEIGKLYLNAGKYDIAKGFFEMAVNVPCPNLDESLFLSHNVYEWMASYCLCHCYEKLEDYQIALGGYKNMLDWGLNEDAKMSIEMGIDNCERELEKLE